jgi:hypothetical protein
MNQHGHDKVPGCRALGGVLRGTLVTISACLLMTLLATGCAATKITESEVLAREPLPRPGIIWVYDFAATPGEVPPDSLLARKFILESTPQTPRQIARGQQLGAHLAEALVQRLQKMGLPAARAAESKTVLVDDLVIRGYLVSITKGKPVQRIIIGFGAGRSELRTLVEGFQMTPQGLRELNFDAIRAGSSKTPGASVSVAGLLATGFPYGLIATSVMKVYEEASGRSTLEGRARATAKKIAAEFQKLFQGQGWLVG